MYRTPIKHSDLQTSTGVNRILAGTIQSICSCQMGYAVVHRVHFTGITCIVSVDATQFFNNLSTQQEAFQKYGTCKDKIMPEKKRNTFIGEINKKIISYHAQIYQCASNNSLYMYRYQSSLQVRCCSSMFEIQGNGLNYTI